MFRYSCYTLTNSKLSSTNVPGGLHEVITLNLVVHAVIET